MPRSVRSILVIVALVAAAAAPAVVHAQTRMLRTPSVSAGHVAFAYAGNIWIVPRSGGEARRLTSFQGAASDPRLSPDGRLVAFTGTYGGNADVYVVPVEGGEPQRITWHPGGDFAAGWTPDGKRVVIVSGREPLGYPTPRFFTVSRDGGQPEALPMPRGWQGHYSPDGTRFAYRMNNSWDDERRNYRGGQNRPIWVIDLKTHQVESPTWTDSKDIDPAWIGNTVYFLSDRDGVHNVWAWDARSKQLMQVTTYKDFDVKSLETGGGVLVYEQAGYLWLWDPNTRAATRMDISVHGDFPWMMPQWKDVSSRITNIALSPTGKRAVVEARGEIFTIPAEKGDVRNLTNSPGVAERTPSWSPDGKLVAYFSDKGGAYKLMLEPQDGVSPAREVALPDPTFFYTPTWSPDGKKLAYHDTHLRLWVLDVATAQAKVIDTDLYMDPDRSLNPSWSPDSRFIAYSRRLPNLFHSIFVYSTETAQARQLTDGLSDATWPTWDANGKYLYFLASTNFALNSGWLDMGRFEHTETRSIYAAMLKKGEASLLAPESDEETGTAPPATRGDSTDNKSGAGAPRTGAAAVKAGDATASAAAAPRAVTVTIDFDGFMDRIVSLNVPARDYSALRTAGTGTLFFLEATPATGTSETPAPGSTLHRYQLKERKAAVFASGIAQYALSQDGKKVLLRTAGPGGALQIVDTDKGTPTVGQGRLTATLRMWLDPKAEFKQMFDEGWRNQKHYLYVENMQGVDYAKVKAMYEPLLPFVAHRADFGYLLDWMGSEISIGHSYVSGGDFPEVPATNVGLLGADFAIVNGRYRITKILTGENWNPELRAPLAAPGIDARVGDYVMAINGVELVGADDIHRLLQGTANRQTVLQLNAQPAMDGARRVTVVPVANDGGLRTRAWVERNRRIVDSLSGGQLAYVHVPNTGGPGYAAINRYYFAQQDRKGAIIDERFNGGGSAADYIIEVLQRDFDGYFNNRAADHRPFTSPAAGIWGPKVMIINEMAGSGGDLMPYMFKRRKVGTLVGTRTWGGLVGTWDTPALVDGGTMIAPRGGFYDRDGKWAVENEGIAPDVEVENWPRDVIAGHDPQLERAVAEAMRQLKEHPVELKPEPVGPIRARPLP